MYKLKEAQGNIDAVWKSIERAKESIKKAQTAVLNVADIMDEIIVQATAVGGKVLEIVPPHIKTNIDKLTNIADQDLMQILEGNQSSLEKLSELIENIPYRDIKPTSPSENREARKEMVNLQSPDLSAGPQSQLVKQNESMSLEDMYSNYYDTDYETGTFSFDKLRESKIFGEMYDEDMMGFAQSAPASLGTYVRKGTQIIREKINRADLEDTDDDDDEPSGKLQENFALGFRSPGIDDVPFEAIFSSNIISDTGHVVG